jgi:hypothetical protein
MKHVQDLNQELIVTKYPNAASGKIQFHFYFFIAVCVDYWTTYGLSLCMFESAYHNDDTCHYNSISKIGSLTFTHLVHVKFSVRMGWTS